MQPQEQLRLILLCPKREQDYQETQNCCNRSMRKKTLILYPLEQVGLLMEILSSLQKYQTSMTHTQFTESLKDQGYYIQKNMVANVIPVIQKEKVEQGKL